MQFINYFLASFVSFSGLLMGIVLVKIAPEEQKPLHGYFELLRKILLFLIFSFLLFYYSSKLYYIAALLLYLLFIIFLEYNLRDLLKRSMIIYTALGVIFYLGSKNINLFAIESSLILLYGIATSSLIFSKKDKNYSQIFLYNMGFLLVSSIAYFL